MTKAQEGYRPCDEARLMRCHCGRMTNKRCFELYGACFLCRKNDLRKGKYKVKKCVTCGASMFSFEWNTSGGYCRKCVTRTLNAKEKAASIAEHLLWLEKQPQSQQRKEWLSALAMAQSSGGTHRHCDVAPATAVAEVGTRSGVKR